MISCYDLFKSNVALSLSLSLSIELTTKKHKRTSVAIRLSNTFNATNRASQHANLFLALPNFYSFERRTLKNAVVSI